MIFFFFFGCWPPPPSRRRSPLARSPPLLLVVCLKDDFFISLFLPHLPRRRANKAPQCLRAARPPPQQQKGKQKEATRESRGAKWGAKGQSFLASTWERDSAARLVAAPIETLSFHFHPSYLHGRRHVVPVELADLVTVRCQDGLAPRGVRLDRNSCVLEGAPAAASSAATLFVDDGADAAAAAVAAAAARPISVQKGRGEQKAPNCSSRGSSEKESRGG